MSKLVTLSPTLPKRGVWANQTVILSGLGEVTFDAQGNLAVPETAVLKLLEKTQDTFGFTVLQVAAKTGEIVDPNQDEPEVGKDGLPLVTQGDPGDEQPEPTTSLSKEDEEKLNTLSANALADQEVHEQLEGLDLIGLLKLAAEFPDLTKEKIAIMSDAKLRKELYDRLTKE